jgi:hypothetical protein
VLAAAGATVTASGLMARLQRLEEMGSPGVTVIWIDESKPGCETAEERLDQFRSEGRQRAIRYCVSGIG